MLRTTLSEYSPTKKSDVSVKILTSTDVARLGGGDVSTTHNENKSYLLMTYKSRYEKAEYALPLQYMPRPSSAALEVTINRLAMENATLRETVMKSSSAATDTTTRLQQELTDAVQQNQLLISRHHNEVSTLRVTIESLTDDLEAKTIEAESLRKRVARLTRDRRDASPARYSRSRESPSRSTRRPSPSPVTRRRPASPSPRADRGSTRRTPSPTPSVRSRGRSPTPPPSAGRRASRRPASPSPRSRSVSPGRFDPTEYVRKQKERAAAQRRAKGVKTRDQQRLPPRRAPSPTTRSRASSIASDKSSRLSRRDLSDRGSARDRAPQQPVRRRGAQGTRPAVPKARKVKPAKPTVRGGEADRDRQRSSDVRPRAKRGADYDVAVDDIEMLDGKISELQQLLGSLNGV